MIYVMLDSIGRLYMKNMTKTCQKCDTTSDKAMAAAEPFPCSHSPSLQHPPQCGLAWQ